MRDRWSAFGVVDDLPRGVARVHVLAHGHIDCAGVLIHDSIDDGDVGLAHLAIVELPRKLAMGLSVEGHDDHAGGVTIEPMNNPRPGELIRCAQGEAIALLRPYPRHRKHAHGLVQHENAVVSVDDFERSVQV